MANETEGELQAPNPAESGAPAESPPATVPETPEPVTESSGEETAESQAEKEKPKGGFQRRISELVRREREAKEEAQRERAEKYELMKRLGQPNDGEPKREQFDSWDEYERANTRYLVQQEMESANSRVRDAETQRAQQEQAATINQEWEERLESAREAFDDIDEYVDVVGMRLNAGLAIAIKASEKGPEIVRHLGQHPKDLSRITSLPPVAAIYELLKIETRLAEKPKASAAPTPATPVKTTTAPSNPLRDDAPVGDWIKARREQLRK